VDLSLAGAVEVRLDTTHGVVVKVLSVHPDGQFSVRLPDGTYAFTGQSPHASGVACVSAPIVTSAGGTALVTVACNVP